MRPSRSHSRSHRTPSRSYSRGQSRSGSPSHSHSHRQETGNKRSRSTSRRREGTDFSSRRGEIGYGYIGRLSHSERFSLIVRGFRDRIEQVVSCGDELCSRHVLEDVFSKYGKVTDVHIPRDFYTQYILNELFISSEQRGFAFIEFDDHNAADDAISHVNGTSIGGSVVSVGPAKNNRKTPEEMRKQYKPYGKGINIIFSRYSRSRSYSRSHHHHHHSHHSRDRSRHGYDSYSRHRYSRSGSRYSVSYKQVIEHNLQHKKNL